MAPTNDELLLAELRPCDTIRVISVAIRYRWANLAEPPVDYQQGAAA